MPKLRVLSVRQICDIMSQNGFPEVRRKGSHIIMQKRDSDSTVMVPVPDHSEVRTGTLLGIIRQSGLPRSLFEAE